MEKRRERKRSLSKAARRLVCNSRRDKSNIIRLSIIFTIHGAIRGIIAAQVCRNGSRLDNDLPSALLHYLGRARLCNRRITVKTLGNGARRRFASHVEINVPFDVDKHRVNNDSTESLPRPFDFPTRVL